MHDVMNTGLSDDNTFIHSKLVTQSLKAVMFKSILRSSENKSPGSGSQRWIDEI